MGKALPSTDKERIKRKSRFKRAKAAELVLTERDTEILQALYKYRFLTTEHILKLTNSPGRRALNKRLRKLFDAKYIDRPRAQIHTLAYGEKRPMVYALGNAGADILANRFQMRLPDIYWTEKNRRVKEKFIEHTLGIADFMIGLEVGCTSKGNVRLISKDQILAASSEGKRRARDPFRWQTRVLWQGERLELAVVPDAVFGLEYLDKPAGRNKAYFFVEIDRGMMPILRRDVRQTSFVRKMFSYADSFERKLHTKHYNIKNFRVLTITTGSSERFGCPPSNRVSSRMNTMIQAYQSEIASLAPPGIFLFASKTDLEQSNPLDIIWRNGEGEEVGI